MHGRVVDAHVHFWDPSYLHYPWLAGLPALDRAFLPHHFGPLRAGTVDGVLFVEANCGPGESLLEASWVDRLADEEPRIAGIVAFVDLLAESRRDDALDRMRAVPRVVGVRHNIQNHPAGFALQPAFVRGVQAVGARGLPFDICVTASQVGEAADLVERCPESRFVLDHCGKPAIREDAFDEWAAWIERLASYERVSCKLSGLLTECREDQRNATALAPYVAHVARCFGPSRLLYGSDWPVSTLGGGAELWGAIVDELIAEWPDAHRRALYGDNAMRVYGLPVAVHG